MIQKKNENITFFAQFYSGGLPAAGLAVTASVMYPAGLLASGAAVEVDAINAPGLYSYTVPAVNVAINGNYVASFSTAGVVDQTPIIDEVLVPVWLETLYNKTSAIQSALSHTAGFAPRYYQQGIIILQRATDFVQSVTMLGDLTGVTNLFFTVKRRDDVDTTPDAQAIIQISEAAGLLAIAGIAATVPANGSITIDNLLAGNITIRLVATETLKLTPDALYMFDIKADNTVLAQGDFYINSAVTYTIL